MHILLVANGYPPSSNGGVETYTYNLANQLVERGHHVRVLCRLSDFDRPDGTVIEEQVSGISVTRIVNDFKNIDVFEQTYRNPAIEEIFEQLLFEDRPDLIHYNHLVGLSSRLPFLSAFAGIPSVFTIHDFWLFCARINLVDWKGLQCPGPDNGADCYTCMSGGQTGWQAELRRQVKNSIPFKFRQILRRRLLLKGSKSYILKLNPADFSTRKLECMRSVLHANRILSPSEFVRRVFSANGYPNERIEVVPLGVDRPSAPAESRKSDSPHSITFAFIGSLLPAKGLDIMIEAFRKLQKPEARLLIYGDETQATPEFRRLLVNSTRADGRIKFMGLFSQEQRSDVFRQMDVLVLPSRQPETFSLVAREALAHSRPVLAVETGALPEIIQQGQNGWFFPPDDPAALLRCLELLCSKPDWLDKFAAQSPDRITLIDDHSRKLEEIYREISTH